MLKWFEFILLIHVLVSFLGDKMEEFQIIFSEEAQSVSIKSDLTPEISAVDLEIRWFKGTDCVCFYKNRHLIVGINYKDRVILPFEKLKGENNFLQEILKNISSPTDVGDYLCRVTREGRTKEITLSLTQASARTTWKQSDKQWTDEERIKMTDSALLAVFSAHEKALLQTEACSEMDWQFVEGKTDTSQPDNDAHLDKKKTNSLDRPSKEEEECKSHSKKMKTDEVAVFTFEAGKTNDCHKKFIPNLQSRIQNLKEVRSVDESDVVLIFCPIVSRAGTDIDAALAKINYPTASKLTVLVVLHHTFDPEKTVSDSSKSVNRENLLTVDCLFYEDAGLLDCQRNSDAYDKSANWLIAQGHKIDVTISQYKPSRITNFFSSLIQRSSGQNEPPSIPADGFVSGCLSSQNPEQETKITASKNSQRNKLETSGDTRHSCQVKYFLSAVGDAEKHHECFINHLEQKIKMKKVSAVKDCDVILLFCPEISDYQKRTDKLVMLISLNSTNDQESAKKIDIPNRRKIFPVDVFLEGKKLLDCQLNNVEINSVLECLNELGKKPEGQNTEKTVDISK